MIEIEALRGILFGLVLTSTRIGAAMIIVPFLSNQVITGMARTAVAMSLAMIPMPFIMAGAPEKIPGLLLVVVLFSKEILIGVILGFVGGLAFWMIESVGFLVDNQRGSSMAEMFDPSLGGSSSPLSVFLTRGLICIFFSGGGFLAFVAAIYESYRIWPVFSYFPQMAPTFDSYVADMVGRLFAGIILCAAPIVIIMFLTDFLLGIINRFAQQLNVFFLAMSIKSLAALFLMILYTAILMTFGKDAFFDQGKLMELVSKKFL
jgi:type III secretion protein T